ncbi:MAG: serine/threonine protein kinase [Deltaproteobacteria bacterium]|nr:MAG: serine/threonine protein kinase [Deltaproteobacteria bacterium]
MDLGSRLIDGKYQLVALAGEGGMASVYKAVVRGAAGFQRTVAVKHIKPEFRALKNYIDMFIEEARVGSELAHPNIVQVHDFCSEGGSYYLIMEWVEGIDLGALIKVNRDAVRDIPWPVAASIAIGTLRGLGAAHDRVGLDGRPAPVIHRDVSPHNVLLGLNGAVKLSDFGLARARDRAASLTAPGTVKGKLSYLAPEVTFGKPNTVQSDLFGVGSVLWETLTGDRLFDGKNDIEIFKKIRACQIPSIQARRKDIPAALAAILEVALSADPTHRYATADEFAHALDQVVKQAVGVNTAAALGAAVAEARAQLRVVDGDTDDLPTTEHRTDEMAAVEPDPDIDEPIEPADTIEPVATVDLHQLHKRHQLFGGDLAAPTTVPGTRRRLTPGPDHD